MTRRLPPVGHKCAGPLSRSLSGLSFHAHDPRSCRCRHELLYVRLVRRSQSPSICSVCQPSTTWVGVISCLPNVTLRQPDTRIASDIVRGPFPISQVTPLPLQLLRKAEPRHSQCVGHPTAEFPVGNPCIFIAEWRSTVQLYGELSSRHSPCGDTGVFPEILAATTIRCG